MSCITLASAYNNTNELMMMETDPYAEEENKLGNIENSPKNESDRIGENVESTDKGINNEGYLNISFNDGYNGYCINKGQAGAKIGDGFTVKDTSAAINNNNKNEIGNYLKILFVEFYDYIIKNPRETQKIIWSFSDDYKYGDKEIINEIKNIAKSGRVISDHGEEKIINNTTKVIFDFEVLDSDKKGAQNFFGYKLTYKNILNNILGDKNDNTNNETIKNETIPEKPENNTTENETIPEKPENNTTENETIPEKPENNTTENNNTTTENETIKNETIPENNTTENNNTTTENETIPENNTTENSYETIYTIPVNNSTETNLTDINEKNQQEDIDIQKSTGNPLLILLILLGIIGFCPLKRD